MSKTAVGLFDSAELAKKVVSALGANAFPSNDIRILGEPLSMAESGVMSIPNIDFEVKLNRELRTIGASEPEARAYVQGVKRGGVLVFATGTDEKVDNAAGIMNRHGSLEVEELRGPVALPSNLLNENVTAIHESSIHNGRSSNPGGARVFVW